MKEPIVSKAGQDIKSELEKSVKTLRELRDEVRVKLHLAGMDHETDDGEMAKREARLRKKLKLPTGLIARTHEVVAR